MGMLADEVEGDLSFGPESRGLGRRTCRPQRLGNVGTVKVAGGT